MGFLPQVPQQQYPAGALAAALFIVSGIRGMESAEPFQASVMKVETMFLADVELLRLAFPRRVFTLSQTKFVIDRVKWLYDNRELVGGLGMGGRTTAAALSSWAA
jgi:tyrosine phenol-lyase